MSQAKYGVVLGEIRRKKKIKALTIARHLGISLSTYSRIETGESSASFERVAAICGELKLTVQEFNELMAQCNEKIMEVH